MLTTTIQGEIDVWKVGYSVKKLRLILYALLINFYILQKNYNSKLLSSTKLSL